ncbi:MAG: hypothetical protein U0931_30340 [Vulcanimicrobiota bacterium]
MKIGSWFSPPSTGARSSVGLPGQAAPVPNDSADLSEQRIGLGEGLVLQHGQVFSRDWLGRSQPCPPGPSLQALARAYREGRVGGEEVRGLEHFPQASLLIFGEPSPALKKTLESWPAEQQKKFNELLSAVGTDYRQTGPIQVVDPEQPGHLQERPGPTFFLGSALERLALNGKLQDSRDQGGTNLLDNLHSLHQICQKDGYAGQDLFAWSLVHSAHSKRTFHQAQGKGTCGAATLGYVLWQENPSQMVGALRDWTYQGQATTRTGVSVRPSEAIDPTDPTPPADQIMQASLMNLADPEYTYSLVQDRFSRADGQTRERGLYPEHQQHLLDSMSDREWTVQSLSSEKLRDVLRENGGPVPVTLEWATGQGLHSLHLLSVQRVSDDHVYLRDPAGDRGVILSDSSQQLLGSGFQRMTREEFDRRLRQGLVPDNTRARAGWWTALKQSASQSRLAGLFVTGSGH